MECDTSAVSPEIIHQTTQYTNAVCHLTYGGVPGLTEFITANMADRIISMISQILALEHSPNINDKLVQAWFLTICCGVSQIFHAESSELVHRKSALTHGSC